MKGIDRISVIRHKSKINKNWRHDDLFRILRKDDIWVTAYKNIKNNKIYLPQEIKVPPLTDMILVRLKRLREKVITENYNFKTIEKQDITELNNRGKPLQFLIENDIIVQEVIRMILEVIYEPYSSNQVVKCRQKVGLHDALKYIELKFPLVNWIVQKETQNLDSIIEPKQICKILKKKINDTRFLNLISKLLKSKNFQSTHFIYSDSKISQKNLILSTFVNIYYHPLDEWVENKAKILPKKFAKHGKINPANIYSKISYVRYLDDWLIGINGDLTSVNKLKMDIHRFLRMELKQAIQPVSMKTTNLHSGKIHFLRYEIYSSRATKIQPLNQFESRTTHCIKIPLRFDIPMESILQKLKERGYIKKLTKGYRSISKVNYTTLSDIIIVKHFRKVWLRIATYYSGCTNLSKLQYIHYLLHISCAMTLSHRHRSTIKKIFTKYGKTLTVTNSYNKTKFPYRDKWIFTDRAWQITKRLD